MRNVIGLPESGEETKMFLAAIVESSGDAITGENLDGQITFWNGAAERLFGFRAEEVLGHSIFTLIPAESASVESDLLDRVNHGESIDQLETTCLCKNGARLDVSITMSPVRDETGQIIGASEIVRDVTTLKTAERERKQIEKALRESEEHFRSLADNIAQLAWMTDESGSIFWVNKRWIDYTGTTLNDVRGWGWQMLHHPDHLQRVVTKIGHVIDTGQSWEDIFPIRGKDGTYRWFLSRGAPIRNERQEVVRWLGTSTDITDQLEAEKELAAERDRAEESERLFRAFVTASSDVVYRMNADWTELRRLEGKAFIADTLDPNRSWLQEYIHPDDQEHVLAAINEAIREKKTFQLEHRVIRIDGTVGWAFSRAIPLIDEHGEIIEWFGAAHDLTDRKRAEEKLSESEERFRTMADNIAQFAWMADAQGFIFWYNRRWFEYTGTTLEEMKGWGWTKVHHPDHVERVIRHIQHSWQTGERRRRRTRCSLPETRLQGERNPESAGHS